MINRKEAAIYMIIIALINFGFGFYVGGAL